MSSAARSCLLLLGVALVAGASGCAAGDPSPSAARYALSTGFLDGSYMGRSYKLYVPSSYAGGATPLVLMLHGCSQSPASFAAATAMNDLAETLGFLALYPEQSSADNALECWTWYDAADQARGAGEPAELAAMVASIGSSYAADPARTYALGFSSGAAMAVILGATYPDVFSAISAGAGLEFGAATSLSGASNAQSSGGPSPTTQGQAAYAAMGAQARLVRVQVIQGSADQTVAPVNGDQVISQWAQADDLASDGVDDDNVRDAPDETDSGQVAGGRAYTTTRYKDATTGTVVLEKIVVSGMAHDWSGGVAGQSYTDAEGPNASALAWAFFSGATIVSDGGALSDAAIAVGDGAVEQTGSDSGSDSDLGSSAPAPHAGGCAMAGHPDASAWLVLLIGCALLCARIKRRV